VLWNWFIDNQAPSSSGGGALYFGNSSGPALLGNWFEGNSAGSGGGLSLESSTAAAVDSNTFVTNTANIGAGIHLYEAGAVSVTNNIIARNISSGGAGGGVVASRSPVHLVNNTISDNTGDGVWFYHAENIAVVNNIISGNSGDGIERSTVPSTTVNYTVAYNDVYNNSGNAFENLSAGSGNLAVDPKFVAGGPNLTAYYHIQASSPISTTGSMSWAPARDIDLDLRDLGGSVSMGADEIPLTEYRTYLPLTLKLD
jgi:parallel beta-helix repeat protein